MSETVELLRHMLAIIAYRGGKVLRDAPGGFGATQAGPGTQPATEKLAHINDVLEWGLSAAEGNQVWDPATPQSWDAEVDRFFDALHRFDKVLAATTELPCPARRLLAGPLCDTLMHFGQLSTLRRLAGSPVMGENYYVAEIETGRVGPDQAAPVREFE